MKLKTIRRLVGEGAKNIITHRLMAFASIVTVVIGLIIFGAFYITINLTDKLVENMKDSVEIMAFVNDDASEDDIDSIKKSISNIPEVENVTYISPEEGLENYKTSLDNDNDEEMKRIVEVVSDNKENPIPGSFSIKVKGSDSIKKVSNEVAKYDKIYKVDNGNLITKFLTKTSSIVKVVGIGIMSFLLVAAIFLIANSIKISVFVRKQEISIIKYIGATNSYVRLPFIIEGVIMGIIGAIISVIVISTGYLLIEDNIINYIGNANYNIIIPSMTNLILKLMTIEILIASFIGVIGSCISIRKYLNV